MLLSSLIIMPFFSIMHTDGNIESLAFDWITGNIYAVTFGGYILACDAATDRNFSCATVLSGQGSLRGITLNPVEG